MGEIVEFRWHGRGGQGTVTAAKILAEAALEEDKYMQAFPEYGPERMGAPLTAYNRLSQEPIYIHCQVRSPHIVVVVDPTLLVGGVDVKSGAVKDAIYVVNTTEAPSQVREKIGLEGGKVFTVDATGISRELFGRPMPNTPMLGALAKVTGSIKLDSVINALKKRLGAKFSDKIVNANITAAKRAYEEVKSE